MKIKVKAKINPSEDPDKVAKAVNNLFPSLEFDVEDDRIKGESDKLESLEDFKNKLGLQAIRDSARREFKKNKEESRIHFLLNKQAAFVDNISFSNINTPLDPIEVQIKADNIDDLINYLAPGKKERMSK